MKYSFKIEKLTPEVWRIIEQSAESTCFHTKMWFNYLNKIGYSPIIIKVIEQDTRRMAAYYNQSTPSLRGGILLEKKWE